INGIFLLVNPIDAARFVRKDHSICVKIPYPVAQMGDALGFFKPGVTLFQFARECLTLFVGPFAVGHVGNDAHVLEISEAVSSSMRNRVQVLDGAIGQENSMLDIQIHAVLRCTISELLHPLPVLGVNSVEYEIERRIRFSCEAQNSVGFVRPNQLATAALPSESSRITYALSPCQSPPPSS